MRDRRDANERDIIQVLRRLGAVVIYQDRSAGFDLLVCHRGMTFLVEVKDGAKSPSSRRLTPAEEQRRLELGAVGVQYHILTSVDDALKMVGLIA